jgi:hypothetical protein
MSKVIFLSGTTMGDSLGGIGRSQRDTYSNLGYDFIEVNLANADWPDVLSRVVSTGDVECVVAFMGMASELPAQNDKGEPVNYWDGMGIPYISLFGDSPAYFFDRHVLPSKRCASLYAFREHLDFRKKLPSLRGLLGLMPPTPLDAMPRSKVDFKAKERGKLYFLKNGNDPEKLVHMWRQALSPTMFLMLMDVAAELGNDLTSERGCDIDAAVITYFHDRGLEAESLLDLRLFFVAQLDDYLRRLKSTFVAQTLLDFPIEVHGYNWEHIEFSGKKAKLVHGGSYGESRGLIEGSLAILDMSPNTSSAPHERVSRAVGMYTLCVTNDQVFFREVLPGFDDCMYRFERDSLRSRVSEVLERPRRFVELGAAIAEAYRAKFDLEAAARRIVDAASCVRMACAGRTHPLQNFFGWPPTCVR